MKSLRKFFFPMYFLRAANGKFWLFGRLFIFMAISLIIAGLRAAYEGKHDLNELAFWDILYVPALFGITYQWALFILKKIGVKFYITDVDAKHWRSQLAALGKKKTQWIDNLTYKEAALFDKLRRRWKETYGFSFTESMIVNLNKWIPAIWIVLIIALVLLFI